MIYSPWVVFGEGSFGGGGCGGSCGLGAALDQGAAGGGVG